MRPYLFAGLLLSSAALASGDTIYSSFGPLNSFNGGAGINLLGSDARFGPNAGAGSFTVSTPVDVTSATFAIFVESDATGSVSVALTNSAVDGSPGTVRQAVTVAPDVIGGSLLTISLNQTLDPGTYWFTATPVTSTLSGVWFDSNTTTTDSEFNQGVGWLPSAPPATVAFSVSGTTDLPSPTFGGLLLPLIAGGLLLRARRRPC